MLPKLTPLMQQYGEIKSQHPDKIVLFRMGDFFEMFATDAETAAPILGIALTQRNKKAGDSTKMCGVPHHSIATPIAKLLQAGFKVAICDQVEDPALAKGLVKRAVTRVLTPGMVYDPDTLDQLSAHYLAAFDDSHLAFADVTTGQAFYFALAGSADRDELLALLSPAEVVTEGDSALGAVERLKAYIEKMQGLELVKSLGDFEKRERKMAMRLSAMVIRHLEIFSNSRGEPEGSLFWAIRRTQTAAGARLLKSWLSGPLIDPAEIGRRHDEVQMWSENLRALKASRETLSQVGDLERRLGKLHSSTFNARDLRAIAESILNGAGLAERHPARPEVSGLAEAVQLAHEIDRVLNDELPIAIKEGGLIKKGVVPELDELIHLTQDSQKLLLELEEREKQKTGVSSLKVRYNNVFGFYIEMTKTHAHKAPDEYRRKQTLANAERFTTDELQSLEEKILSARTKRDQLELEIYQNLKDQVIGRMQALLRLARTWARWDVLSALAWLALERGYRRPSFSLAGELHLEHSRHPVVEQAMSGFVANTVTLKPGDCMLLTGPNMAGKSTLMRQVALNAILAQIGSFVPAENATLPLFHQIFTRIGASDSLSEGLSTFMVEMSEASAILQDVNSHSLVVMDEIGRGTSTYDGLSLAQAILEYLVSAKKPYLLFATHYHELTALERLYPQIRNAHMGVQEKGGHIQFLHSLQKGPANRSYGIHVAKLAGLPASVTNRAQQILTGFEQNGGGETQLSFLEAPIMPGASAAPVDETSKPAWLEEFKAMNLAKLTPLDALNKLFEWQKENLS